MGWKRDQSAVNVPCRSVTSGVHRVLFTMLNPSSAFPCEYAELRKRGLSTARSRDYLERRRSCLTRPAVPLFSRMRTKGLSLVLQCTRGRPLARSRDWPHRVFWLLPGVRLPPFLELTSLTSSIILEKGVGQYSPSSLVLRQSPGYLVLDGYHCLHSLTPFPRVGGGGRLD